MSNKIEISNDTPDGEQFAAYLNGNGYNARVGRSTGNYIDGVCTSHDEYANVLLNGLWERFCNRSAAA